MYVFGSKDNQEWWYSKFRLKDAIALRLKIIANHVNGGLFGLTFIYFYKLLLLKNLKTPL